MANALPVSRQLLRAVEQIIPRVQENNFTRIILAQPPISVPQEARITSHVGKPLAETKRQGNHLFLYRWPKQQLHAIRFPLLCCVLEGEVDWRIGITQSMAEKMPEPLSKYDYQILTLPKHTFYLMPPGVPYSTSRMHWERPQPELAQSRILWFQIMPSGAICHICETSCGGHFSHPTLFIRDTFLYHLVELLMQELRERSRHFEVVAKTQLLALLLRVERAFTERMAFESQSGFADVVSRQGVQEVIAPLNEQSIKRACAFIEANLQELLTPMDIALHAYTSPSHLNRLFRREMDITIMKYVKARRIENAKSLLIDADLPVYEIGRRVGYSNPSLFSQIFSQEVNISPLEYRKIHRINNDFGRRRNNKRPS